MNNYGTRIQSRLESRTIPVLSIVLGAFLGIVGSLAVGIAPLQTAYAQQSDEEDRPRQATRRIPAMSEQVFNQLAEAQEFIETKEFARAKEHLNKLLDRRRLNGNERGQIYNLLAFVALEQEDNRAAIRNLELVLNEGDQITEGLETSVLYTLAQLHYLEENYSRALQFMDRWLAKQTSPSPQPHVFIGQVYFQMENIPKAVEHIEKAIEIAQASNLEVKENWWAMLRYFYYELENLPKAIDILRILVRDFPKQDYWIQLCGMYSELEMEDTVLACFEAAHLGGHLDRESLMRNYAGLLLNANAPYRAAMYFQEAMDAEIVPENEQNFITLGQANQFSQEHEAAIEAFESAAKLSEKGTTYEQLSQLYFERDEYQKCIDAANSASDKGDLRREGSLLLVKGMCLYNLDRLTQARSAFVDSRRISRRQDMDSDEHTASQWIAFIDKEKQRRDTLSARQ